MRYDVTNYYRTGEPSEAQVQQVVNALKDQPALLAWQTIDEPRANLPTLRDHWLKGKQRIEAIDKNHPVTAYLNSIDSIRLYARYMDVTMVDWYPVNDATSPGFQHPMSVGAICRFA